MVINYGKDNQYEDENYCPICDSPNIFEDEDYMENILTECKTICSKCGHINYWAYGLFIDPKENKNGKQ